MITDYEIKLLAKDYLKDFDLYDASFDIQGAWEYLIALTKSEDEKVKEVLKQEATKVGSRSIATVIKQNYRRWKEVSKHTTMMGDKVKEYRELYQGEKDTLEEYCYMCLGDILKELHPQEFDAVSKKYAEKIAEEKRKREEAKANMSAERLKKAIIIAKGVKQGYLERADAKQEQIDELEKKLADKSAK